MLDISTLMLVLALTSVLSVVGLLAAGLLNRQVVAIRYWAGGLACFVAGLLLQVSSPSMLPLWVSAVVITQAYVVLFWGTRCYRLGRAPARFFPAMLVSCLLQGSVFFYLAGSLRFSIMAHSVMVVILSAATIREIWLLASLPRPLAAVWSVLWGFHGLVYARRLYLYAFDPLYINASSFQAAAQVESLNYLEGIAFVYGFSLLCAILTTFRLQEALRRQAMHDPLTDLFNRRAFEEAAGRFLAAARRNGRPVSLLLMDLDHFKLVNDQYGHKAGDQVLVAFAGHLLSQARSADQLSRYGGEEFMVLLPDAHLEEALLVAERIRQAWQAREVLTSKGKLSVTVSIGVSSTTGSDSETIQDLAERADMALYRAKKLGRNRSQVWQSGLRLSQVDAIV